MDGMEHLNSALKILFKDHWEVGQAFNEFILILLDALPMKEERQHLHFESLVIFQALFFNKL